MKSKTFCFIFVMALCLGSANAQSKLDNLTFDKPTHLIRPKTEWSNVRKQPNAKAPITKKLSRTGSDYLLQMVAAEDANAQWYKVDGGYAFKTAFVESKLAPLTKEMFLPNFYGYSEDMDCNVEWFVADKVGNHELALMMVCDNCDNFSHGLYLGKRLGNVIVFKYHIEHFDIVQDENNPNTFSLGKENIDGIINTTLYLGKSFYVKGVYDQGFQNYIYRPNFYMFNDKIIEKLFGELIEKGANVSVYITAECFPADCKNIYNF